MDPDQLRDATLTRRDPVKVVLDYPASRRAGHPLRRRGVTLGGGLIGLIGVLGTIAMVPFGFFAAADLTGAMVGNPGGLSDAEVLLAAAAELTITAVCLNVGFRLLSGRRELVLLLRRFGYGEATSAATFAAEKTIGRSFRLVTLDDAAVVPLGVAAGARRVLGAEHLLTRALAVGVKYRALVAVLAPLLVAGLVVVKIDVLHIGGSHVQLDDIVGAWGLAIGVAIAAPILYLVCLVPVSLIRHATERARTAERSTRRDVKDTGEIDALADALAAQSRKILAPRLVVLRSAPEVWQQTVTRVASVALITIIDVSEPTENLLWEIQELTDRFGSRCVFVGQIDRVGWLSAAPGAPSPRGASSAPLLRLLAGREVLAYRTDPRGQKRFARALQNRLLALSAPGGPADPGALGEAHRRGWLLNFERLSGIAFVGFLFVTLLTTRSFFITLGAALLVIFPLTWLTGRWHKSRWGPGQ
jgi:hypothetical protein